MYLISQTFNKKQWNNSKTSLYIEGENLHIPNDYGGLGARYYKHLATKLDEIQQVDTTSGITETNGSVRGRSVILALALKEHGVVQSDIILISSRCHSEQTIVVLASLYLGAIIAPLDPDIGYKECKTMLSKLKPKICFCDIRSVSLIERVLNELNVLAELYNFNGIYNGSKPFIKLFTHKEYEHFTPIQIRSPKNTIAFVVATQGTTGHPKLVSLSHNNIFVQTLIFLEIVGYPKKIISYFPLSWIMEIILMCSCFESQVIRIIPGEFKNRQACKLIHDLEIDFALLGTQLALQLVSDVAIKDFNISCLKCIMVGTITTTKNCMQRFRLTLPKVKFIQTYASTETGLIASSSVKAYEEACKKPSAVGPILNNSKIKIVDFDTREIIGPKKFGELVYSGDGLMLGYFKDPQLTASKMEKGFFKTGDVAQCDENGWLYVQGRIDDLVCMEDCRFSPIDLEDILLIHPFVQDVVVIGDGVELLACILKKTDSNLNPEGLMRFLFDRLPENLHPTRIVFLEDFPKTSIGKIKKHILREKFFVVKIAYSDSLASITL